METKITKMPEILYEDGDIAVVFKPAGLSTHPGAGKGDLTLVDFLKKSFSSLSLLSGLDRPGIVHRLDKDTSGLLLITKTDCAYLLLADEMKKHHIKKYYQVLVSGHLMPRTGSIESPIGRSYIDRKKMTAFAASGRPSVTHYKVLEYLSVYFGDFSFLEIELETGRTHQIRVHFKAIRFPVVGDSVYGNRSINEKFEQDFGLRRQFLHAYKIDFPLLSGMRKTVEYSLPFDLENVLKQLRVVL